MGAGPRQWGRGLSSLRAVALVASLGPQSNSRWPCGGLCRLPNMAPLGQPEFLLESYTALHSIETGWQPRVGQARLHLLTVRRGN